MTLSGPELRLRPEATPSTWEVSAPEAVKTGVRLAPPPHRKCILARSPEVAMQSRSISRGCSITSECFLWDLKLSKRFCTHLDYNKVTFFEMSMLIMCQQCNLVLFYKNKHARYVHYHPPLAVRELRLRWTESPVQGHCCCRVAELHLTSRQIWPKGRKGKWAIGGSLLYKKMEKPQNQALGLGQAQFVQVRSGGPRG